MLSTISGLCPAFNKEQAAYISGDRKAACTDCSTGQPEPEREWSQAASLQITIYQPGQGIHSDIYLLLGAATRSVNVAVLLQAQHEWPKKLVLR